MNHYEQSLLVKAISQNIGNPYRQLANDSRLTFSLISVRVITDGWYHDGAPVKVGQKFKMPIHDAAGARALGRVEFM